MSSLPIEQALPSLKEALERHNGAVLVAAPGAGKTTRVPLALMDELWLGGRKMIMLEPRRLAARSAANYMARQLGEPVGRTVGYRVRMDSKVGPETRIEVVTEGVLTRMLQEDQALEGVGLVIFDEYHERSLQADLGLALSLQTQALLRDDLRLLIMSATLEAEPVARLLGDAPVVVSEGRSFPVDTFYRPVPKKWQDRAEGIARVIREAMARHDGDALVFVPGMSEIRAVERIVRGGSFGLPSGTEVHLLHGSLPPEAQDRAIAPPLTGIRKIVLSTSVAETSLTVEGVTIVVDSGLARVSRFSPRTGMSRLETVPVSSASADQRRGRAGRVKPGVCYRMWSEEEQGHLPSRSAPEITEADLAPLLLELAVWGVNDPAELEWLDAPPKPAVQQARELLVRLGALASDGTVTGHGRRMAEASVHPRLAHMILAAEPLGLGGLACELAALLGERDLFAGGGGRQASSDMRLRVEALRGIPSSGTVVDDATRKRISQEIGRLRRELGIGGDGKVRVSPYAADTDACGLLLAFAYPDRIARRRESGAYLFSGGRGAELREGQALAREEWLVAADVDDVGADSRIRLAAPVQWAELAEHCGEQIAEEKIVFWDRESQSVRARSRRMFGALLLEETPLQNPPPELVRDKLLEAIRQEGLDMLPWSKAARQLQERIVFMARHDTSWPDASDETLAESLEHWLAPYVDKMKSRGDLQRLHLKDILEAMLSWNKKRELDEEAPTHWNVPSGSRIPIDYSDPEAPALAVRLQELFGLPESPRIGGGRVALTLHLLSPAQRPVQVTRDLASFWRNTYFEVRKDLKGRYPKHYWPDNPLEAQATRRAKPPGH
ncbi:ATP-dependent helicase HrpB [Cohnella faecalis]|uniref:ATP-dependent helicase HrpB n=1 Tax=Cohnella faecalis TaxID=2315694 RepID=A0A398CIL0_9BACL|nr:ATP-dependent helicase HrpB [Cohnella faecalis]RIE02573.1 ATP-dependent helicase HrpB [Cohnella faecalis]